MNWSIVPLRMFIAKLKLVLELEGFIKMKQFLAHEKRLVLYPAATREQTLLEKLKTQMFYFESAYHMDVADENLRKFSKEFELYLNGLGVKRAKVLVNHCFR